MRWLGRSGVGEPIVVDLEFEGGEALEDESSRALVDLGQGRRQRLGSFLAVLTEQVDGGGVLSPASRQPDASRADAKRLAIGGAWCGGWVER